MNVRNGSTTAIALWAFQPIGVIFDQAGNPIAGAIEHDPALILQLVTIAPRQERPVRVDLYERNCPGRQVKPGLYSMVPEYTDLHNGSFRHSSGQPVSVRIDAQHRVLPVA